jgi:hypothetical protein
LRYDLLRKLSERATSFAIYKHVNDALEGRGDVDALISPDEQTLAEHTIKKTAMHYGVLLLKRPYRSYATSYYLVAADNKVIEIDLNTRPQRCGVPWMPSDVSQHVLMRHGIRRVDANVEALTSYVYHHTRAGRDNLQPREIHAIRVLSEAQVQHVCQLILDYMPWGLAQITSFGFRRRWSTLRSNHSSDRISRGAVYIAFLSYGLLRFLPRNLKEAYISKIRGRDSRLVFRNEFIRRNRQVDALGGIEGFLRACVNDGGSVIFNPYR